MFRRLLKLVRDGWKRVRLRIWAARLRVEMHRNGGRLRLELGRGASFDSAPRIDASPRGEGRGTLTLRIGDGVRLGRDMTLDVWAGRDAVLEVGAGTRLANNLRVELRGGKVTIGPKGEIRDFCVFKSDGELSIGSEVLISYGCTLHCTEHIEIGDACGLAERVSVIDSDHATDGSDEHFRRQPLLVDPVRVGRNVLLSSGAVVLRGATLGDNLTVAANAVVPRGTYPRGWLIAGTPARKIKRLDGSRRQARLPAAKPPGQPSPHLEPDPG